MLSNIVRTFILYLVVLISLRLMGKRQIGEMQPFEFVITFMIAELAAIPMAERTVPLLYGAIPVFTLLVIHFILTMLIKHSLFFRKTISGKPVIVVTPDGINYEAIKKLNMTINDLAEGIRAAGFFSFSNIAYAILETNGNFSVFPKFDNSPTTKQDLKINGEEISIPTMLIAEKKFLEENLAQLNLSREDAIKYIKSVLKQNQQKKKDVSEKDILLASLDGSGNMFVQKIDGDALSGVVDFKQNEIQKERPKK